MALRIIIGDPFACQVSVNDDTANTLLTLANNYTVSFSLRQNNAQGNELEGLSWTVANNIINLAIQSTDTASYPKGVGVLLMKVENTDTSIILRHKETVNFVKEDI